VFLAVDAINSQVYKIMFNNIQHILGMPQLNRLEKQSLKEETITVDC